MNPRLSLALSLLLLLIAFLMVLASRADATLYPVIATDGLTTLTSDGEQVEICRDSRCIIVTQAGITSFTFMDSSSALMNRVDGHLFILQLATGAVFHLSGPRDTAYPSVTPCALNQCLK